MRYALSKNGISEDASVCACVLLCGLMSCVFVLLGTSINMGIFSFSLNKKLSYGLLCFHLCLLSSFWKSACKNTV